MSASRWVMQHINRVKSSGHILDLACGGGRHLQLALDQGYRVTGVDRDVSLAASSITHPALQLMTLDLETGQQPVFKEKFDGIVVTNYLYRPLLACLPDWLMPGGILIYETFMLGNEAFGRPRSPDFLLAPDELRLSFQTSLVELDFRQGEISDPYPAVTQSYCGQRLTT